MQTEQLLHEITEAARGAGKIMLEAEHIEDHIDVKSGHANFATEYDSRVQEYLIGRLSGVLPGAHFLGEEEGQESWKPEYETGYTFVIDPIDGTSNFMKGLRNSVTSIGLLLDGEPYIGVIYHPYYDEIYTAVKGQGAFCNGKPVHSSKMPMDKSLVMFGTCPYYPELVDTTFCLAKYYLPKCIDLRRYGSAAWDMCLCASGRIGMYFEMRLSVWDYAAAALIAGEAGCTVTAIDGSPLSYRGSSSAICAGEGVAAAGGYLPPSELMEL